MSQKVDVPSGLTLGGSALLVVSLFLHWFGRSGEAISGWTAFESLDLVLAALAVGAAAIASGRVEGAWPAAPRWLPAVCGAAFVVVFVQLVDPPPIAQETSRQAGIWLALVATVVMSAGAALSVAGVSLILDVRGRDLRRRVPVVDRRPTSAAPEPAAPAPKPEPRREPAISPRRPQDDPDDRLVVPDDEDDEPTDPDRTQAFDVLADREEPRDDGA